MQNKPLKKQSKKIPCAIKDYTVAPIFMEGKEKGAHEWIIEFEQHPENPNGFKELLDKHLQEVNSDYAAKRYLNTTLKEPSIHFAQPNLFYNWLKSKGKLGGQHKIPRLSNNRDYLEELLELQSRT